MRTQGTSVTLTVHFDGQFWVRTVERVDGAAPSTKAQAALAEMREQGKEAARKRSASERRDAEAERYALRREKRRQKRRGH